MDFALALLSLWALTEVLALPGLVLLPQPWMRRDPALLWAMARVVGLALVALIAAALTILSPSLPVGWLALALGLSLSIPLWPALAGQARTLLRALPWPLVLTLVGCVLYGVLFAYNAKLIPNAERAVNISFLLHAAQFPAWPPMDPWMAGETLNYYHWAYWQLGLLYRMTPGSIEVWFLAALVLTWARVLEMVALLTRRLMLGPRPSVHRRWLALFTGTTGAVLIVIAGNFDGLAQLLQGRQSIDWWHASRVIPGTITEPPWFSALHGDLHPYLLALAPSLTILAAVALAWPGRRVHPADWPGILLVLATLFVIHTWNFYMLLAILGGLGLIRIIHRPLVLRRASPRWAVYQGGGLILLAVLAVGLSFGLRGGFDQGHRPLSPVEAEHRSLPLAFFLVAGPMILAAAIGLAAVMVRRVKTVLGGGMALVVTAGAGAVTALAQPLAPVILALLALFRRRSVRSPLLLPALMIVAGALGLLAVEFVLVEDYYGLEYDRLNTVFKVHFFCWFLLGMGGVSLAGMAGGWWGLAALVPGLAAGMVYTIGAVPSRNAVRAAPPALHLQVQAPEGQALAEAAAWLRSLDRAEPLTLMEGIDLPSWRQNAWGHYIWAGFATILSGHRAVLVWPLHESGWRPEENFGGRSTARVDVGERWGDVRTYFTTPDGEEAQALLDKYQVDLVVWGPMEQGAYPEGEARITGRLEAVWRGEKGVTLYRAPGRALDLPTLDLGTTPAETLDPQEGSP